MDTKQESKRKKQKLCSDGGERASANVPSPISKAAVGASTSAGLDSLPAVVLGTILSYCQPQDVMQLRVIGSKIIKKESDGFLYHQSLEKLKSTVTFWRRFTPPDNCANISIGRCGEGGGGMVYRSKAEAIEFALDNLTLSQEEKTRAMNELSSHGLSSKHTKKGYWRRRFDMKNDLTNKKVWLRWNEYYRKLKEWQDNYLSFTEHLPEERRETRELVQNINGILSLPSGSIALWERSANVEMF